MRVTIKKTHTIACCDGFVLFCVCRRLPLVGRLKDGLVSNEMSAISRICTSGRFPKIHHTQMHRFWLVFFFVCSLSPRFSFLVCANFLTRFGVAYLPCLTTRNALCPQGRRCVSASPRLYSNQSIGTNYVIHQGGHGICHGTERTRYCAYYLLVQPVTLLVQVIVFVNGMACCCCCYAPESVCLFSYVFVSLPQ